MKSGNLNFLKASGPLQACNGTALPFLLYPLFWRTVVKMQVREKRYLVAGECLKININK